MITSVRVVLGAIRGEREREKKKYTQWDHSLHPPAFSTSPSGSPFESLALQERIFPKRLKVSYSALLSMFLSKFRTWFGCRCAKPRKDLCCVGGTLRHTFSASLQKMACDYMKNCHFSWASWDCPWRWTRHDKTLAISTECATKTLPRPPESVVSIRLCFKMISCLKQHKSSQETPILDWLWYLSRLKFHQATLAKAWIALAPHDAASTALKGRVPWQHQP